MASPKTIANRAELIIGAAEELFARDDYERTSIDDILFTVISIHAESMKPNFKICFKFLPQILGEPVLGQMRHLFQRAWFLKQMSRAIDHS